MTDLNNQDETLSLNDKKFTLLCIDDEVVNLKVIAAIFKEQHRVVVSKSAAQGFSMALEIKPDLILLDVLMPEENGFDLIVKFKNHPVLKHIPVIFITGLQSTENEEKGLTLGACDYIHKPFNYGIVRARVNTHLEIIRQRNLLAKFAHFDSLTELPNRRKWQEDALEQWNKALLATSAIVYGIIDIDFFKKFNDHNGHQQGDIVLREVAHTIKRVLYKYQGDIYRCGGEEFYFYIPNVAELDIYQILEQSLDSVFELEIVHETSLVSPYISVSIGAIKLVPNDEKTLEQVMKCADENLYQVKSTTRNAVCFTEL